MLSLLMSQSEENDRLDIYNDPSSGIITALWPEFHVGRAWEVLRTRDRGLQRE